MIGTLGDSAISGVYVGSQLQTLLQMFIGGIEGAILILAAQYWGKRDTKSIRRIAAIGVRFALLIGLVITATAFLLPSQIVSLFTSDASVIESGTVYVRVVSLSYIFFCISQVMVATMRAVEPAKAQAARTFDPMRPENRVRLERLLRLPRPGEALSLLDNPQLYLFYLLGPMSRCLYELPERAGLAVAGRQCRLPLAAAGRQGRQPPAAAGSIDDHWPP